MSKRPLLFLLATALCAACEQRPPEFGVSVFAMDTLPVRFRLSVTGSLVLGVRSTSIQALPDRSLVILTPSELVIQRGEGTATITALRGDSVAVQPLGVFGDSAELASVQGTVVRFARAAEERRVAVALEKP